MCHPTHEPLPTGADSFHDGTADASALADAFSEFIAAAGILERSYRELQTEVTALGQELAARNAALEGSLRENERMRLALVALIDSMPCGVLVLDAVGHVERMNAEARALLELSEADAASDLDAIAATSGVDLRPFAVMAGESELSFSPRNAGAAARRWIELRTRPLPSSETGADGDALGRTILILRDISAHKQAEGEREAGRRALALAEVAATLAHEIRNPLASMELFTDLLEVEPQRSSEWLGHLRAGLRGLANTVHNVLSFHAAEAPHLRPVALGPALDAAAEFVRPIAHQAGIALVIEGVEPGRAEFEGEVLANEAALQQVVLNLVTNAIRHTPPGGQVRVALRCTAAGGAAIEVADTGSGIAREHLSEIFRAGWSASGASPGLGLAVCQRIAVQHGATLVASSEPGRGTCFLMEFPCR